ncbi:MAG: hypothetical protein KTR14_09980 [Vampirovibrio sp.]|nr:hypothetical protein [Vampirovibrio sp.]
MILSNEKAPEIRSDLPYEYRRRWYDKDFGCTLMVDRINEIAPEEVKQFAVMLLDRMVVQIREAHQKKIGGAKSLGIDAVKEMYRSRSHHRRWYDEQAGIKKAVGSLYSLPNEALTAVGFHLSELFGFLTLYGFACESLGMEPDKEDLAKITSTTISNGSHDGKEALIQVIGQELYDVLFTT